MSGIESDYRGDRPHEGGGDNLSHWVDHDHWHDYQVPTYAVDMRIVLPPAHLSPWIQCLSLVYHPPSIRSRYRYWALPESTSHVAFIEWQTAAGRRYGVLGVTATGGLVRLPSEETSLATIVRAHPGAGRWLLGVEPRSLGRQVVALEEIWGSEALDLRDELAAVAQHERPAVWWRFLSTRLRRTDQSTSIIGLAQHLIKELPNLQVKTLANELGFTERSLHRHFLGCLGLSPKAFMSSERVVRVARQLAQPGNRRSYADLAAEVGYFDQSHLLNDFRKRVGMTPQELVDRSLFPQALNARWLVEANPDFSLRPVRGVDGYPAAARRRP